MTHLGDKVAGLVDGQLSPSATETAHAHLARCRGCRDLVEAERLMKARLTQLSGPAPGAELVGRLLALGGPSGPLPPRPGHVPGSVRPATVALPTPVRGPSLLRSLGSPLARGPVRTVRAVGDRRPPTYPRSARLPAVRPGSPRRMRLAGAVLGALGVVGAGVTGLVYAASEAPGVPAQAPLDSIVVQLPAPRAVVTADVSMKLRQNGAYTTQPSLSSGGGR